MYRAHVDPDFKRRDYDTVDRHAARHADCRVDHQHQEERSHRGADRIDRTNRIDRIKQHPAKGHEDASFPVATSGETRTSIQMLKSSITQITPQIFISGVSHLCAEKLVDQGITHVLTLIKEIPTQTMETLKEKRIAHKVVPFRDKDAGEFARVAKECVDWIHKVISGGGKILIHCFLGLSRSPSIVIAYLMKYGGMDYFGALKVVKSGKPERWIVPHFTIEMYLRQEWSKECKAGV